MSISRRAMALAGLVLAACVSGVIAPAGGATPAEAFVSESIDKGLGILNDERLTQPQRRDRFGTFLLGITDMRRVALFTLGRYAQISSPAEQDVFVAAFQRYAVAVYQSHFAKYAGQTLRISRSVERAPGDFVVRANLVETRTATETPMEVSFRINTDSGKPLLVDISVAGIWLGIEERDQFAAVLSRNNGSIPLLVSHLDKIAAHYE